MIQRGVRPVRQARKMAMKREYRSRTGCVASLARCDHSKAASGVQP